MRAGTPNNAKGKIMNLFKASNQWAERPADERYWSIEEMTADAKRYAGESALAVLPYKALSADADNGEVLLVGSNQKARLTHWGFGQIAGKIGAPASYLRQLPADLAARNLSHGLAKKEGTANLLFHANGGLLCRCATSDMYERIWNWEVGEALQSLQGWKIPPARPAGKSGERTRLATAADILSRGALGGLSIKVGDTIAPAGVYASDKDMFVFMVDDHHVLRNPADPATPLARGFFVWNSEVGDRSFGVMTFLYDAVCGNHIVWNVSNVQEVRVRHVGTAREKALLKLNVSLTQYADASASEDEALIARAQSYQIAATKEETLAALLKFAAKENLPHVKAMAEPAYLLAEQTPRYGSPRSPWGISQAMTQLSQDCVYADKRAAIDAEAGKVLHIAF